MDAALRLLTQKSFVIQKISLCSWGGILGGGAGVTFFGSLSPVASQKSFEIQKISLVAEGRILEVELALQFFEPLPSVARKSRWALIIPLCS
ncbi:hypothetical protein BK126_01040 [Paenibacillus sp. FSL H7-0326]|nr:hypothetical protein BK126_01040 [Paenibacillus sp. FSL H7-0326]